MQLSNQGYAIESSANLLSASLSTILNNSQASQNTLLMYIRQLEVMESEFDTFASKYFDSSFSSAISTFQGIFAVALTGSLLVMLGVLATHLFDLLTCRLMVHLGWAIFGLVYVGVIVVMFVVLSVGSIGYGFCNYYQSMLNS
jgi:hypothetical protein